MIDDLVAALRAEFAGEVQFHPFIPSQFTAPSVVVTPASEPYLEPREGASAIIREHWEILVCVSLAEPGSGLAQMRENSLRVRKVCNASGAVWDGASGPRRLSGDPAQNPTQVVSINSVHFRYDASTITT